MEPSGFMIAAPSSGSGKTIAACALMAAFRQRNRAVRAAKCGPDYIDPMFHREALGVDSVNLDRFFSEPEELLRLYESHAAPEGVTIIEGVMGYYDGMELGSTKGSAYEIAGALDLPVILILPCRGMGTSVLAVLKGMLEFQEDHRIRGIILNRISAHLYPRMKEMIEQGLEQMGHGEVEVLGFMPVNDCFRLESRHLGLVTPMELERIRAQIEEAGAVMSEGVDLDRLAEITRRKRPRASQESKDENALSLAQMKREETISCAVREEACIADPCIASGESEATKRRGGQPPVRIAVARDEAFCFYYRENLRLLESIGCEIATFSPLRDRALPERCAGLLLGGGYPELYAKALSENEPLRREIRERIAEGMPCLAECGGFLYLQEELCDPDGNAFPMVGALRGKSEDKGRLTRFGYVSVCAKADGAFLKQGEQIRGHEFHHWDSTDNGDCCIAYKPDRRKSWDCIHMQGRVMAGFPHFYYPSNRKLAERFVQVCQSYALEKKNEK